MKDHWRHMQKMTYSMSVKLLADVHLMGICYLLDSLSYLVYRNSWFAYRYGLIESFLSHLDHLLFDFIFRLAIKYGQIVITVMPINVDRNIDIDLISKIKRPRCWYSMDEAFVNWNTDWLREVHESYRSGIGILRYYTLEHKQIDILFG